MSITRSQPMSNRQPGSELEDWDGSWEWPAHRMSRALGWFSIGLGATQLMTPGGVNRLIGIDNDVKNRALQRLIGMRELMAGVGILANPRPAGWLWARVGGDLMDAAVLTASLASQRSDRDRVRQSLTAVLGILAADAKAAMETTAAGGTPVGVRPKDRSIPVEQAITIWRQPAEVFAFWRNLENLPRFMNHLESVRVTADARSHWVARGPAGRTVEWDAEIVEERPNELIAWRSLDGSDVRTSGSVRFAPTPDGEGTEVLVRLHYSPPAGVVGMTVARLFGEEPHLQVKEDLRRFKQVMEVGEVVLSEGTAFRGARARQHPAQPSAEVPEQLAKAMPFDKTAAGNDSTVSA